MNKFDTEKAAREYWIKKGHDPDEKIKVPHPEGYAVVVTQTRWQNVEPQFIDLALKLECLVNSEIV